ncbi:MAG TPA: SpoIIE family protein phosphatase [Firmicutes bacterium]|nr:SpoIIE family protein phosphatase [Bacillota bacterium]
MGTGSYARWAGSGWVSSRWAGARYHPLGDAVDKALHGRTWPLLIIGFLLGRAPLFGQVHPFGLPLFLATGRSRPRQRVGVGLALLAGAFTRGVGAGLELLILMLAAHMLVSRVLGRRESAYGNLAGVAAVVFTLTATVRSAATIVMGPSPMDLALVLAESFLAMLLTVVSAYGLPGQTTGGRLAATEQILALAVLGAGAVAGTAGLFVGPVSLQGILIPLLTMVAGHAGGPGLGAAVGVVTGLVTATPGPAASWAVAVPAFAGLAAGVFRELGRAGTGLGGLLGSLLMTFYAYGGVPAGRVLVECAAALLLFAVMPAAWLNGARTLLKGVGEAELGVSRQRQLHHRVVQRLQTVSRLLSDLRKNLSLAEAPCRAENLREFAGAAAFRWCDGCRGFHACWEEEFLQTYQGMSALLEAANRGIPVSTSDLPLAMRKRCPHAEQLVSTVSGLGELYHASRHWQEQVQEYCFLMQEQVGTLAGVMERLADEVAAPPSPMTEAHPLGYEIHTARLPRAGESVPGDAVMVKELGPGRLFVVLSDGMGAGDQAEASSEAACSLVMRMVDLGFDLSLAVRLANLVLQRQGEAERFVTLDAALFDLDEGRVQMLKLGAAPSYLKRGKEVTAFRSPSWPVGILPVVKVEPQSHSLEAGDVFLMASDGLWEQVHDQAEDWVEAWVARSRAGGAGEMAERLLSRVTDYGRRPLGDDLAMVVVRVLPRT